jgi:hypothetical protein
MCIININASYLTLKVLKFWLTVMLNPREQYIL